MNYWWVQFCDFILQNEKYRDDFVMRNSTCHKAVAEVLNARYALHNWRILLFEGRGLAARGLAVVEKTAGYRGEEFPGADLASNRKPIGS